MKIENIITSKKVNFDKLFVMFITSLLIMAGLWVFVLGSLINVESFILQASLSALMTASIFTSVYLGMIKLNDRVNAPRLETISNLEKNFALSFEDVIKGDLTSSENQTIIFTAIKDDRRKTFAGTIENGMFTLAETNKSTIN